MTVVLPIFTRIVSANPPLPLLQPALAWLNLHVAISQQTFAALSTFVDATGGDAVPVVLSDNVTVQMPVLWSSSEEVSEAAATIAAYLSLTSARWNAHWLTALPSATESSSGAVVPFRTTADPMATALCEHLCRRLLREAVTTALLQAVAASPLGTPSPADVLQHAAAGVAGADNDVATFDVCDCGVCYPDSRVVCPNSSCACCVHRPACGSIGRVAR